MRFLPGSYMNSPGAIIRTGSPAVFLTENDSIGQKIINLRSNRTAPSSADGFAFYAVDLGTAALPPGHVLARVAGSISVRTGIDFLVTGGKFASAALRISLQPLMSAQLANEATILAGPEVVLADHDVWYFLGSDTWPVADVTSVPFSFVVVAGAHCILSLRMHTSMRAAGLGFADFGSFAICNFSELVPAFDATITPFF